MGFEALNGMAPYVQTQEQADAFDCRGLKDSLRALAATNIKKTGGGGSSDTSEIWREAETSADFLRDEIAVMEPDIVLCGGTFGAFTAAQGSAPSCLRCSSGAGYLKEGGVLYVDLPHPGVRVSEQVLYAYFRETILDLVARGLLSL